MNDEIKRADDNEFFVSALHDGESWLCSECGIEEFLYGNVELFNALYESGDWSSEGLEAWIEGLSFQYETEERFPKGLYCAKCETEILPSLEEEE